METRFRLTLSEEQLKALAKATDVVFDSDAFCAIVARPVGEAAAPPLVIVTPEAHIKDVLSLLRSATGKDFTEMHNDPN